MKRVPQRGGGDFQIYVWLYMYAGYFVLIAHIVLILEGGGGGGMAVVDDADLKTVEYMQVFYF